MSVNQVIDHGLRVLWTDLYRNSFLYENAQKAHQRLDSGFFSRADFEIIFGSHFTSLGLGDYDFISSSTEDKSAFAYFDSVVVGTHNFRPDAYRVVLAKSDGQRAGTKIYNTESRVFPSLKLVDFVQRTVERTQPTIVQTR